MFKVQSILENFMASWPSHLMAFIGLETKPLLSCVHTDEDGKADIFQRIHCTISNTCHPLILASCMHKVKIYLSHNVRKCTFVHVNPAKIQISLLICSLIRFFTGHILDSQGYKVLHAYNEDSDQSVWMCRLIWVFTGHTSSEGTCSGPSCSKLMMSLVNDSLKFTSSDMQICWYFLLKKCE